MTEENEQLYAIADYVPNWSHIVKGKPYPIKDYDPEGRVSSFQIKLSNDGPWTFSLKHGSAHLDYGTVRGSWTVVRESELTDEQRERAGLPKKVIYDSTAGLWCASNFWINESSKYNLQPWQKDVFYHNDKGLLDHITAKVTGKFDNRFKGLEETAKRHEYSLELQSKQDNILAEEWDKLDAQYETLMEGYNGLSADQKQMYKEFNQRLGLMAKRLNDLEKENAQRKADEPPKQEENTKTLTKVRLLVDEKGVSLPEAKWGYPTRQKEKDPDGWIPWGGGERPVDSDTIVSVKRRHGDTITARKAGNLTWRHHGQFYDIIAYRPAKQEAEWPQVGDTYYVIGAGGEVYEFTWRGDKPNLEVRDFLGIYPARAQAEEAAGKIKRVMDHWRSGGTVYLEIDHASVGTGRVEGVKL